MLKKANAKRRPTQREARARRMLAQAVLESSHQIWLAGLGAFCARRSRKARRCSRRWCKQGEVARDARREQAAVGYRGGRARRRDGQGEGRCSRWPAERGTSWSRCSRIASRARCRSSASTRRTTSSGSPSASTQLAEAVNELLKSPGEGAAAKASTAQGKGGEARAAKRRAAKRAQDDEAQRDRRGRKGAGSPREPDERGRLPATRG